MPKKFPVMLSGDERAALQELIGSGRESARALTHARILLKADQTDGAPAWSNARIAEALEVSELTVTRVRKRYCERGLQRAVYRKEQLRRKAPKLDGAEEARLIALACTQAPEGRSRWTLRLLADRMVELGQVESISHETVRQVLKRGISSRG